MSRFLIFIGVALAIILGVHYYLWARLVRDPHLPPPAGTLATFALVLLAVSMPVTMALSRLRPGWARALAWPAFTWMGLMFLLLVGVAALDLVRLVVWVVRHAAAATPHDPERRTLIARVVAATAATAATAVGAVAIRGARPPIEVARVDVALARLPRAHDGLRLVQISDVHVGPTIGIGFVRDVVARINALEPDIVAITGDLVDGTVEELSAAVAPLGSLRARHGVYFVTGNHEYYSGAAPWIAELRRIGIRVLDNECVSIGEGADAFDLAGIADHSASQFGGPTTDEALALALAGRDRARELVLLAHQPRQFVAAQRHGVGLQLAGHTHGGQVWPFTLLVRLAQPFVAGLHRRGDSQIYVSRGTGYWGPPMRLGAPAEITHVVLRRA
ncbi:MAG TPA: metallophosphoesterase [Polyangia bacterium]|nr:metallophosphoesterase [Polyangia bacterium]